MKMDIQKYLKRVKKEVRRSGDFHLEYFKVFEQEVESFLEENPQAEVADLESYFGTPEAIAADYLASLPDEELQKKVRLRQKIFSFVRTMVIILVIVIILLGVIFVFDTYQYNHGETQYSVSEMIGGQTNNSYQEY